MRLSHLFQILRRSGLLLLTTLVAAVGSLHTYAEESANNPLGVTMPPKWTYDLPAGSCDNQSTFCHFSSPVVADITGDERREIVVATNNGHVVAMRHDGTPLWNVDLGPVMGIGPNQHRIRSSPAVADIDNNGSMEIVVATGGVPGPCAPGGVVVLAENGSIQAGWPQYADDLDNDGCAEGIGATPALGDLDNDGTLEIVVGGFDKRIHVWNHDGTRLNGFSVDSYHYQYRGWSQLIGRLGDTIWSSPALADIDRDGYLDIVIGTDEGYVESFGGWDCPYALPGGWEAGYCGGSLYVVDRFGNYLPGFPRYVHETMQSSPAIVELDGDEYPEIVVGTGSFYRRQSPDQPNLGARVYAFNHDGTAVAGWNDNTYGGRTVDSPTPVSPATGDLDGDGDLEVVTITYEGQLYAWHHTGTLVNGFPMGPLAHTGLFHGRQDLHANVVLGDYDGDGAMEIFLRVGWEVTVVDGNGEQITADGTPNTDQPTYITAGSLLNTPALGDLDNNGKLDIIAANSQLIVWEIDASTAAASWPLFRRTPARSGSASQPQLSLSHSSLRFVNNLAGPSLDERQMTLYVGGAPFTWEITVPERVSVSAMDGASPGEAQILVFTLDSTNLPVGAVSLGEIVVSISTEFEGENLTLDQSLPVDVLTGYFDEFIYAPNALRE